MAGSFNLYERLESIKRQKHSRAENGLQLHRWNGDLPKAVPKPIAETTSALLPGWERIAGLIWRREKVFTLKEIPKLHSRYFLNPDISLEDIIFIDTETTGLHGAGTIVFLIGLGRIRNDGFYLEQLFLADFPGEGDFLSLIDTRLREDALYVSYNGKAFDRNILLSRFFINGYRKTMAKQLDLLYPCRRLYAAALPSCSLSDVEKLVLKIERESDIPGFIVPERYFSFLKSGRASELIEVFSHHEQDVYNLMLLLFHLEELASSAIHDGYANMTQLARLLLPTQPERGCSLLVKCFDAGDDDAGLCLSFYYKRKGDWTSALPIWEKLFEKGNHIAGLELAKYYEHREKRFYDALTVVDLLLNADGDSGLFHDLRHRKKRIERKLTNYSS